MKIDLTFLGKKQLYYCLLAVHAIVAILVFAFLQGVIKNDKEQYLFLADSIVQGKLYSFWHVLGDSVLPDTLRSPGYPLFLVPFRALTQSEMPIKIVNLLMYFASVALCLRVMGELSKSYFGKNIFLFFLLLNIQIATYTTTIFTEPLMVFLIVLYIYLGRRRLGFSGALLFGFISAWLALIRPVFLLFPVFWFVWGLVCNKGRPEKSSVVSVAVFLACMLPYGFWNLQHHGSFQLTPLEGKGMFWLGYWQLKLPDYREDRLYTNYMGNDAIWRVSPEERQASLAGIEEDWKKIAAATDPFLLEADRKMIERMNKQNDSADYLLFPTYNSQYTVAREKILQQLTLEHIKADFPYYAASRIYAAIRLFVTGVNQRDLNAKQSLLGRVKLFYPTLVSFLTFFLGGIFLLIQLLRSKLHWKQVEICLFVVLYYWLIQVPFVFTSRYTIPIQMPFILLLSMAVYEWARRRECIQSSSR